MNNRLNFFSHIFCALVFMLLFSFNANSQGPHATDVDLKAAYCYPTVKYEHEEYNKLTERYPNTSKANEIKNLNEAGVVYNSKLQIYLRARNQSHNLEARNEVLAAISAGEQALNVMKKIKNTCSSQLDDKNLSIDQALEKIQSCLKTNGSAMLKLEICNNLSFLPY